MRRTRVLVVAAVVTALLAASGTAYAALGKTVTVTVDGHRTSVRTFAGTVDGALKAAGVSSAEHDLVVPAPDAALHRGSRITVRHAKQVSLSLDGERRDVWVLADSVGEALDQLGLSGLGAVVSASRSRGLPPAGFALAVRLPHAVTVLADGRTHAVSTTAATVAALLGELRIVLASTDRVSAPLSTYPAQGATVRVTRIRSKTVTETVPVAFSTKRVADSSLAKGSTRTERAGRAGALVRTYAATWTDGRLTAKRLLRTQRTATPVTAVIRYGTRTVSAGGSSYVAGRTGGLNWAALARCESGGNPRAVSSSGAYRGLYQFSISTWHSVGGSGDPINASAGEQTARAYALYTRSGRGPWPICGRYL